MIEVTGSRSAGPSGVRRLVEQHGEVEDHREREPGDVLPARRGPAAPARSAGATMTAIRPATTNQDDDTRTSTPAIVPIRKVPGGRGAGDGAGSDTPPSYWPVRLSVRRPTLGGMSAVESPQVVGSLSPSRAGDFLSCPLLYRFRTIDRLPEPSSPDAVRGTLVHKVLEDLFDLPAAERTRERGARACWSPPGRRSRTEEPRAAEILRRVSTRPPGWPAPARPSTATSRSRTRPGSSRPSARCTSSACSTPGCCCAASSTGSTSPRTGRSEWSTTRPEQLPPRASRPGRCSR